MCGLSVRSSCRIKRRKIFWGDNAISKTCNISLNWVLIRIWCSDPQNQFITLQKNWKEPKLRIKYSNQIPINIFQCSKDLLPFKFPNMVKYGNRTTLRYWRCVPNQNNCTVIQNFPSKHWLALTTNLLLQGFSQILQNGWIFGVVGRHCFYSHKNYWLWEVF